MGKVLIIIGIILILAGIFMTLNIKVPFLGRLPGDLHIKKDGYSIYIPLATSLILSILLSVILYLVNKYKS